MLSAYENIVLPIQLDGSKVDEEYINQVIETLGLSQNYKVYQISFQKDNNKELLLQE